MPTLTKEECLELESMNITYDEMAKVCGYKMSPNNIAQCFIKYGIKHKTKVDYVLENVDFNEGSNLYLARKYKVSLSTIKRAKRKKKMIVVVNFSSRKDGNCYRISGVVKKHFKNKKVKILSLAQIGLQEHSKNMIGNAAVLINGYSQHGKVEDMINTIKSEDFDVVNMSIHDNGVYPFHPQLNMNINNWYHSQ